MGAEFRKCAQGRAGGQSTTGMSGLVPDTAQTPQGERLRIWQAEQYFHCPVAGMCLTLEEQRRLSARADPKAAARGDFHMHECVVANLTRENALSRRADALLARKFAAQGRRLLRMDEGEFLRHWRSALQSGDFAAELWAAAVSRGLSHAARVEVFGSSHVAFHEMAKSGSMHAARLQRAQQGLAQLKERLKEMRQAATLHARDIAALRGRLAEGEASLRQARAEIGRLSGEAAQERALPAVPDGSTRLAELEAENGRLAAELLRRDDENERLRTRIRRLEPPGLAQERCGECSPDGCTPDCPSFDLCRKRVLIVGGPGRMEGAYRRFVEERGGIFEYHDGRLRGGIRDLETRFLRADVVLCPVNCNSHGACLMVKNLGKKHRKPVHMLPGFGLGTVSRAMAAGAN